MNGMWVSAIVFFVVAAVTGATGAAVASLGEHPAYVAGAAVCMAIAFGHLSHGLGSLYVAGRRDRELAAMQRLTGWPRDWEAVERQEMAERGVVPMPSASTPDDEPAPRCGTPGCDCHGNQFVHKARQCQGKGRA